MRRAPEPSRRRLRTLAGWLSRATAVLALLAAAPARADELVRLLSPPAGATLEAGSAVVLEWAPGPDLATFPRAEEWEVFLSLDGGRTYLARITPHLDLGIRRVTVRLPDLPSADARLLLRMGDERIEREQELPGSYRIARPATLRGPAAAARARAAFEPVWRATALRRGEPARPGHRGVSTWIEGNRDGSGWTERRSTPERRSLAPGLSPDALGLLAVASGPRELLPVEGATPSTAGASLDGPVPPRAERAPARATSFALLRRRNE